MPTGKWEAIDFASVPNGAQTASLPCSAEVAAKLG